MNKVIFFDVDGTLVGKSQKITENNQKALSLLRKNGYKVFLCTGRMTLSAMIGLEETEIDGMITLAGGVVYVGNDIIFENKIDKNLLKKVIQLFDEHHIYYSLETRLGNFHTKGLQDFYLNWIDEHYKDNPVAKATLKADKIGKNQYLIRDFHMNEMNVQKMTFIAEKRENFEIIQSQLEDIFNINYFSQNEKYIDGELILKDCTKITGIEKILQYYQSDISHTVAFGDSMNDYEMLSYVDTAIAYINAPEQLKALAIDYFDNPDQDGIYQTLLKQGFIDSL